MLYSMMQKFKKEKTILGPGLIVLEYVAVAISLNLKHMIWQNLITFFLLHFLQSNYFHQSINFNKIELVFKLYSYRKYKVPIVDSYKLILWANKSKYYIV